MKWKRSELCLEGKHFFVEEKENTEGMGGKYSDKENIFLGRRKTKKEEEESIQKGTYLILRGEQERRRKGGRGMIWRRKLMVTTTGNQPSKEVNIEQSAFLKVRQ